GDSFTEDAESSSWVPLNVLDAHDAYVLKIRFAPGPARLLATCSSDGTAQIWQSHSDGFSRQCGFNGHPRWVWDCAFGADRRSFYTACSDGVVRLWDLSNTGQQQSRSGVDRPLRDYRAPKARPMGVTSIALIEGHSQSPIPSRPGWLDLPQGSDFGKTLQELDDED
ncbi:Target of rapamycin complex subunit lst8, partial [Perkinsus olseni]